jgi:hypothetical protein
MERTVQPQHGRGTPDLTPSIAVDGTIDEIRSLTGVHPLRRPLLEFVELRQLEDCANAPSRWSW